MKLTHPDKIGVVGISVLFINILLQTLIFPSILKSHVKKRVALKNGWPMREIWSKLPYPLEHHWYIFNVTNPDEISMGGKPKLREVGPFVYDAWQEKINQEDHEEDDTLSYTLKNTFFFNQAKSNGLDDDDELVMAHLLILGIPNGLMRDRPFLMPIASRAIDNVLNKPSSVFVKTKVKTTLFDGFPIDCRGIEDFHGKVLCNEMRDNHDIFFMVKTGENTYANSFWGPFNGTDKMGKRFRIRRGINDIMEVGTVEEYLHKKNFSTWKTDLCDRIHGTDYTIFPPFCNEKKKENFFVTFGLLCRSFEYTFDSTVEYKGLKLLRYTTAVGPDSQSKPEDKCYCLDPNQCLSDGVFDVYKCLQIPLIISSPHYYQADPRLLREVEGLKPDKVITYLFATEKHMMIIDIDPLTGFAVRINLRLQIGLNLMPLQKYRLMENFPVGILPMVWVDMQTTLPYFLIEEIKACHRIVTISKVLNYLIIISGLGMCVYGGYHQYKLRREKNLSTITKFSPGNSAKHSVDENKIPIGSAVMPASID